MAEPFGNSVFELTERTPREATYRKFEEHPYANRLNYSEFSQPLTGSNQKAWSGFSTGKIDGMESFTPPNVYQEFPDWSKQSTPPEFFGMGVLFNHDAKHANDRRVRRAIAHLVNRTDVARSSGGPLKVPVKYATGLFNRGKRGIFPAQVTSTSGTTSTGCTRTSRARRGPQSSCDLPATPRKTGPGSTSRARRCA